MLKRALTITGLVIAGAIAPLATAAPASATVAQCTGILHSYGYAVGAKSTTACGYPHSYFFGKSVPHSLCVTQLVGIGVTNKHAISACEWA